MAGKQCVQVVWFKRDLRAADHRPLYQAAQLGPVLPLFVAEPELWQQPDMSGRQWAFASESLAELREELAALGQPLVLRTGSVTGALQELAETVEIAGLWSHEETGNDWTYRRDKCVAAWCRTQGIHWTEIPQNGVIRRLPVRDGWAARWDRFMGEEVTPPPVLAPLPEDVGVGHIPQGLELGLQKDACPGRQTGGRAAGLSLLDSFLNERGKRYRTEMSSPLSAENACSRLSPHLAWGTLSMREAAQATWARQRELKHSDFPGRSVWRGSMSSFSGRLHWHCHFMQKLEDEPRLEFANLHSAYDGLRPREGSRELLQAWSAGETGLPFVDACMRSLNATGWINFRMRAMLMAVASYHLWLDWRAPGEHLARKFTDYEPGIHWPQVQMQSGTTGINTVRIYNPVKQGYDQDPEAEFVRRWVPELQDVPDRFVHEPWRWEGAGTILGKTYPEPVVDHLAAAKAARQKVWAVRGGSKFRDAAKAIQSRHGSRKSGMRNTGRRRSSKSSEGQLSLQLPTGPAQ